MKLGFVTCVQLGLSCMEVIYRSGYELDAIFTLRDDLALGKSGRIFVDDFARENGVKVYKIAHVNDVEAVERYKLLDWLFIVGWSQIAAPQVINAPHHGVLGMHPTLLPVGRGRASIPWAILKGFKKTGVTLFKLDEGVDTGPVLGQVEISIGDQTTATELYRDVADAHGELIKQILPKLSAGDVDVVSQDESLATFWPGRRPEDGLIDMSGSVDDAERLVRAVTRPYPGAYVNDSKGRKVVIWSAAKSAVRPETDYLEFRDGYLKILEHERSSE